MKENKAKYEPIARQAAQKYGIDPELFVAQIQQESGWNPNAKSPVGAGGIAQIMPATAKSWGVKNVSDPIEALNAAAKNMAGYVKTYQNNKKLNPNGDYLTAHKLALAAYNSGPGNVSKHGGIPPFSETKNYVKTITKAYSGKEHDLKIKQYSDKDLLTFPSDLIKATNSQEEKKLPENKFNTQGMYTALTNKQTSPSMNLSSYYSNSQPKIYQSNDATLGLQQLALNKSANDYATQLQLRNQNVDAAYKEKQDKYKEKSNQLASIPIYQPQDTPKSAPKYLDLISEGANSAAAQAKKIKGNIDTNPKLDNYGLNFDSFNKYLNMA